MKRPAIYILASHRNGTLYIGVTTDLTKRTWEHKNKIFDGFTKKYSVHRLVYFEFYEDLLVAFAREKAMKQWNRLWKIKLIESVNPNWNDLYDSLLL